MDTEGLQDRIRSALASSRDISALDITVEVEGGRVRLSGEVESHEQVHAASRLAAGLPGVREVVNHLAVRELRQSPGPHERIPLRPRDGRS